MNQIVDEYRKVGSVLASMPERSSGIEARRDKKTEQSSLVGLLREPRLRLPRQPKRPAEQANEPAAWVALATEGAVRSASLSERRSCSSARPTHGLGLCPIEPYGRVREPKKLTPGAKRLELKRPRSVPRPAKPTQSLLRKPRSALPTLCLRSKPRYFNRVGFKIILENTGVKWDHGVSRFAFRLLVPSSAEQAKVWRVPPRPLGVLSLRSKPTVLKLAYETNTFGRPAGLGLLRNQPERSSGPRSFCSSIEVAKRLTGTTFRRLTHSPVGVTDRRSVTWAHLIEDKLLERRLCRPQITDLRSVSRRRAQVNRPSEVAKRVTGTTFRQSPYGLNRAKGESSLGRTPSARSIGQRASPHSPYGRVRSLARRASARLPIEDRLLGVLYENPKSIALLNRPTNSPYGRLREFAQSGKGRVLTRPTGECACTREPNKLSISKLSKQEGLPFKVRYGVNKTCLNQRLRAPFTVWGFGMDTIYCRPEVFGCRRQPIRAPQRLSKMVTKTRYKTIRPLLNFSRENLTILCKDLRLPVYPDKSNKAVQYSRNRLREQIIPAVKLFLNPKTEDALFKLAELLTQDFSVVSQLVNTGRRLKL